jgi:hypothetical protein
VLQTALRNKTQQSPRSQVSQSRTLVAPVKGWHVGSPIAAAPPQTAFLLENAFPELDHVRARGGSAAFATGMPNAAVTSLMRYSAGTSGATKMFASCNGSIFDVTSPGAVGAPLVTGLDPIAPFVFVQFAATGAQNLMAVNGVNPLQLYNGSTWGTSPAITGLTGNPLNYLWVYKSNVWAIQSGSLDAWYLPGSTIGGPISKYPMSPLFARGGSLIAGGTWGIPATDSGIDHANVFVTDQGEVAIFTGDTPALTNWNQLGVFRISPPVGPKCLLQAGGDLAIMTQDGIIPVSTIQNTDQIALQNQAVTRDIQPAWRDAVLARQGLTGWQIISWPNRSMAVVTLPHMNVADNTQFVANARTGAWCRYTGWDVQSMEVGGLSLEKLFYGTSDGRVMQAETGGQDDGKPYTMTVFPSYTDLSQTDFGYASLSQSASRKQLKMVRPRLQSNGAIAPKITVNTDFDISVPTFPPASTIGLAGALWGVALWGVDVWPQTFFEPAAWVPAFALGAVISPIMQITFQSTVRPDVRLTATDILFEVGSIFG